MIRTNLPECPNVSRLWLAVFLMSGSAFADDHSVDSADSPIVLQQQRHSKSSSSGGLRQPEFAAILNQNLMPVLPSKLKRTGFVSARQSSLDSDAEERVSPTSEVVVPDAAASQPLFAPLSQVNLAAAARSESLQGDSLRTPVNEARPRLAQSGVWQDISGYRATPIPNRTQHPLWYNPLYFEDPNMERCGVSGGCLTDLVSATRFFGRTALLPYMIGSNEPRSCVRALSDCPNCHQFGQDAYIAPLNAKGVALQAACTVGLVFLIP